jgi:hypothetical protein
MGRKTPTVERQLGSSGVSSCDYFFRFCGAIREQARSAIESSDERVLADL